MNIQLITSADEITENLVDNTSGLPEHENKPSKKKRRVFPIVLLILLILAIGVGIYYFYIANKPKDLKNNEFRTSISIDNTIYTGLINGNNTISKIENGQMSEFAALPENYNCDYLLYNENEKLFYAIGRKDENSILEYAIFSINEDGSVNQKIFHTSIPSSDESSNYYGYFQYVQGNFYALRYDDRIPDKPYNIVKITPDGNMEDFYSIKNNISDYSCSIIANNNAIYCACQNKNDEAKLIALENLNGDVQTSESSFDSHFSYFYDCNDEYFSYLLWDMGDNFKVMKYSINDKSTDELLTLNSDEYDFPNVFGDYIFYSQKYETYNENGISSIPIKLFRYNWENKETTRVLDKVFNPADYGITENTTTALFNVDCVTNTGDKILYYLFLNHSGTSNYIYFICNSDGSDDKLLNNRVFTY